MKSVFRWLPIEVVDIILSYNGTIIQERNGKYMKQISKTDRRREMLLNIPIKNYLFIHDDRGASYTLIHFSNGKYTLTMTEYYNILIYHFYKGGHAIDESRFIWN
jgi:hypothetical protein